MLNERLQVLIDSAQRRRLEAESKRRGTSVGSLVREAIDAYLGEGSHEERLRAVEEIRALGKGAFVPPAELDRLAESEHEEAVPPPVSKTR